MTIKMILFDLLRNQRGATAVEYGLICAMIVIAMLTALGAVAEQSVATWDYITEKSQDAMNNADS
jgi:pilus assembly protein Flp/PilA